MMGLNHFFEKDLVFCLHADNQEDLFNQVANLLEERHIVTFSYKNALIEREVQVSLLFFIINNSNASQTNILAQLMDFFTAAGNLEALSKLDDADKLFHYISETINH